MNRFERALAILLLLRSGKTWSAPNLGQRLGVSTRTIYRDIETLCGVGVPIYAEAGREGGYRLVEGYFLPPIAFTVGEATSLLTGLALLDRLRAKPFAAELETSAHKLLAVVPDTLRNMLSHAQEVIGFEAIPHDIFHPERERKSDIPDHEAYEVEAQAITVFLQCIFDQQAVKIDYHSPYGRPNDSQVVAPYGILWDRDRWYLIGRRMEEGMGPTEPSLWRADRVVNIASAHGLEQRQKFQIEDLLNRRWLAEAMGKWADLSPVVIRMTRHQAERLRRDWYYGHATFEECGADEVRMRFGESDQRFVFELLRWLGTGAELIEPHTWREAFRDHIQSMLSTYEA